MSEQNDENQPLMELTNLSGSGTTRRTGGSNPSTDNENNFTNDEMEKYNKYKNQSYFQSVIEDLLTALYEIRYVAPFVVALGALFAYQLTIAPYRSYLDANKSFDVNNYKNQDLSLVRPVLTKPEQESIRDTLLYAETSLHLPIELSNTDIRFKFHSTASKDGHYHLPLFMYEGVTFSLTAENSHNLKYTAQSSFINDDLIKELETTFSPKPTVIMKRASYFNSSSWDESGVAIYYSYAHLGEQGKLSSDQKQPFKRILQDVLRLARKYKQACITAWYPHVFGEAEGSTSNLQRNKDTEIQAEVNDMLLKLYEEPDTNGDVKSSDNRLLSQEGDELSPAVIDTNMISSLSTRIFHTNQRKLQENPLLFHVILQEVIPTRTGLDHLKSTATVWLSTVNGSQPQLKDDKYVNSLVYRDKDRTILAKAASDK